MKALILLMWWIWMAFVVMSVVLTVFYWVCMHEELEGTAHYNDCKHQLARVGRVAIPSTVIFLSVTFTLWSLGMF